MRDRSRIRLLLGNLPSGLGGKLAFLLSSQEQGREERLIVLETVATGLSS